MNKKAQSSFWTIKNAILVLIVLVVVIAVFYMLIKGPVAALRGTGDDVTNPGDDVIFFYPTFSLYKVLANLYNAKIKEIKLKDDFTIPESIYDQKGLFVSEKYIDNWRICCVRFDNMQCNLWIRFGSFFLGSNGCICFCGNSL